MKEQFLKNLEAFKGKSPAFYAIYGVSFVALLVVVLYGISFLENGVANASSSNPNQFVLKKQTIRDNNLGIVSHTIFVPEG